MLLSLQLLQSWGMAGRGKEGEDSPEVAESCSPPSGGVGVGRRAVWGCRDAGGGSCDKGGSRRGWGVRGCGWLCKHSEGMGRGVCKALLENQTQGGVIWPGLTAVPV